MRLENPFYPLFRSITGSLWHRQAFWQLLKSTCATVFGLFVFYICMDASINSQKIANLASFENFLEYYFLQFIKRLPQLLPFALTVTSTHTFLRMQRQNETVSLTMSGASHSLILSPFLKVAVVCTFIVFACTEGWFFPPAELKSIQVNPVSWVAPNWFSKFSDQFEAIPLDHDLERWLIYHRFDSQTKTFHNAFWIENDDSWWHFENLELKPISSELANSCHAIGYQADRFERDSHKRRLWSAHYPRIEFKLSVSLKQLDQEARGPQELPVQELWKALQGDFPKIQRPKLQAYLYYRLIQPMLCVFAPLPAAAIALRHRRQTGIFWVYLISLSSLVALFMIQQSGLLLASTGRVHPFWSIACPVILGFTIVSWCVKRA